MSKDSSMHIAVIPSKQGDNTYYCALTRQSFRDPQNKKKIRKKTLANILTYLQNASIFSKLSFLKAMPWFLLTDLKKGLVNMNILSSKCHGHIEAIICAFKGLGLSELVASKPSLQRNFICALIASRIINPCPKLATSNLVAIR